MKKICLIISLIVCLFCFVACNNNDTQNNVQSGENEVLSGDEDITLEPLDDSFENLCREQLLKRFMSKI